MDLAFKIFITGAVWASASVAFGAATVDDDRLQKIARWSLGGGLVVCMASILIKVWFT